MNDSQIYNTVRLGSEDFKLPSLMYHYTDGEKVPQILKDDGVHLRLTSIEKLRETDCHEGKLFDEYFEKAVNNLVSQNVINDRIKNSLLSLRESQSGFTYKIDDNVQYIRNDSDEMTFVFCFSTEQEDEYMYSNYAPNNGKDIVFDGICLKEQLLDVLGQNGCHYYFTPVFYGNDAVSFFEKVIYEAVIKCGLDFENDSLRLSNMVFSHLREKVRNPLKTEEYRLENEIRLSIVVPSKLPDTVKNVGYSIKDEGEYKYLYIVLNRHCCMKVLSRDRSKETEKLFDELENNYYRTEYV